MKESIEIKNNQIRKFSCDCNFYVLNLNGKLTIIYDSNECFSEQTEKPQFNHDCNDCMFLYTTSDFEIRYLESISKKRTHAKVKRNGNDKEYDMYYCQKEPTIIARYGDCGSQYLSGMRVKNKILIQGEQFIKDMKILHVL